MNASRPNPQLLPLAPFMAALVALAWPALPATAQATPNLLTTSGPSAEARLVAYSAEGAAFTLADGSTRTLDPEQLIAWGRLPNTSGGPLVVLAGGGLLVADPLSLRDDSLRVLTNVWDEVRLPLGRVRGIVYHVPHTPAELDRRLELLRQAEGDRDVLTLIGGDEVRGVVLGLTDEGYTVETEAGRVEIPSQRVASVVFSPALVEVPDPPERPLLVGFRDGSHLTATWLELAEGRLELHCPGLPALVSPRGVDAAAELALVQPLAGQAVYLSDLEPHSYRHLPFLELSWPLGIDRNCLGGRLRVGGHRYPKGLGMHSASRAAFNLDGRYGRFQSELALDDEAGHGGSVIYRVFVGAAESWEQVYQSPVVRGGEEPLAIEVDVTDRQQLLLVVEYADGGDQLDRADWLNARVLP